MGFCGFLERDLRGPTTVTVIQGGGEGDGIYGKLVKYLGDVTCIWVVAKSGVCVRFKVNNPLEFFIFKKERFWGLILEPDLAGRAPVDLLLPSSHVEWIYVCTF